MNETKTGGAASSGWSAGSTDLFSTREISLLIEMVEALPVLYAADKRAFKGIVPREKAWKIISEKLNRTVTECEKKWRYLRDKYVKERRRLIEEAKTTGRESKSNWQHYESMEFLATHLRLPSNSRDGGSRAECLTNGEDEDVQPYSDGSPNGILSPPSSLPTELPTIKSEQSWTNQDINDQFKPLFTPPQYPGFLANRTLGPPFTQNPLLAMWSNSLAQMQAQQQQQQVAAVAAAAAAQQQLNGSSTTSTSHREMDTDNRCSPAMSEVAVCDETSTVEEQSSGPPAKIPKTQQELSINVSIKDMMIPAEKYSEYHFCVSLAQMMENVPLEHRADLKIELIQMITSKYTHTTDQLHMKNTKNGRFSPP